MSSGSTPGTIGISAYKFDNGTYNAVIISFASRKEAMETIEAVFGSADYDIKSLDDYLAIYNYYYKASQKNGAPFTIDDDVFKFKVDKNSTGFEDVNSAVKSLIVDTLKDGDFLTEPRNISGNYVLVYRNSTVYEASGNSTQYKWSDLTDDLKAAYFEVFLNQNFESLIWRRYTKRNYKKNYTNETLILDNETYDLDYYCLTSRL